MSEKTRIAKSAYVMSVATFISRVLGFARDMLTAHLFGASNLADAFFAAFRIPNLFREIFAEGSMSSAFIPVLTETAAKKGDEEANRLVRITFTFIMIFVGLLCLLGIIFAPVLVRIIVPGFLNNPEKFKQTVNLTRIMFPFLLMVSLAALAMGALNTRRSFFVPAMASSWFNISVILTVLLIVAKLSTPIMAVAIGITVGGFFQFASQLITFYRKGFSLGFDTNFRHGGLMQIGILIIPTTFGMAINQINVVVNNIFASYLPSGSITYLYYAMRLVQFPVGIFGVAMSMAALSSLSHHAANGNISSLREDFSFSIRMLFFITIPAMAGLISLGEPIVNILFQRGKFDYSATIQTSNALICYSLGIWSVVGGRIVTSAFYSLKDTKTPFKILLTTFGLNILFSFILMHPLKHAGLALANTIASGINFVLLFFFLRRKLGRIEARRIITSFLKAAVCAVFMAGVAFTMVHGKLWSLNGFVPVKSLILSAAIVMSVAVYLLAAYLVKCEELSFGIELMKKKVSPKPTGN